jgi:hypothetical protein
MWQAVDKLLFFHGKSLLTVLGGYKRTLQIEGKNRATLKAADSSRERFLVRIVCKKVDGLCPVYVKNGFRLMRTDIKPVAGFHDPGRPSVDRGKTGTPG